MMLRGTGSPSCVRRKPVSIACPTIALIAMISPRLAVAGTLTIAALATLNAPPSLQLLEAGGEGNHDGGAVRPERAVGELGDSRHRLRIRKADPGRDLRAPGARSKIDAHHVRQRVLLVEDVDGLHVLGLRHRAFDRDGNGDGVAVIDQRRYVELDLAA